MTSRSFFRIGARIYTIVALSLLSSAAIAIAMYQINVRTVYDLRETHLRDVVDSSVSLLADLEAKVVSGSMSLEDAQTEAVRLLNSVRYDNGNYLFASDYDALVLAHGGSPDALVGTNQNDLTDPDGVYIFREMIEISRSQGGGIVHYKFEDKRNAAVDENGVQAEGEKISKMSYARNFEPWGWMVGTGTYIKDIQTQIAYLRNVAGTAFLIGFLILLGASSLIVRSVNRPINILNARMKALSSGEINSEIPFVNKQDEIGEMAKSVQSFQEDIRKGHTAEKAAQLAREEQETLRQEAEDDKKAHEAAAKLLEEERRSASEREEAAREALRVEADAERTANAQKQQAVVDALGSALKKLSEGDLNCEITQDFPQEYAQLKENFNDATLTLCQAVGKVTEGALSINSETAQISKAAEGLAKRTERQAATLEETAAAMDQLTSSVKSASEGADAACEISTSARENAQRGGEIVRRAMGAMDGIKESSNEISKITSVIDDIAFQTNLLALNAGVEAARAGETGRGFAVVATEVRALAQRSSDAAREINALISKSGEQVRSGVELVEETDRSLGEIVTSVAEISDQVSGIAISAREQATGLSEINNAVNELDKVTQQNAAMFEETTAASMSLNLEAKALSKSLEGFEVGHIRNEPLSNEPAVSSQAGESEAADTTVTHTTEEAHEPSPAVGHQVSGNLAVANTEPESFTDGWDEF